MLLQGILQRRRASVADSRTDGEPRAPSGRTGPETLFFVHIPKCAGSSFRLVLKRWFGSTALFLDTHDESELRRAVETSAVPPRAIAGHIPFGLHGALALRPCYVSLVRHPLDRFVSLYQHARRTPGHPLHAAASRLDLEAFYDFALREAAGSTIGVQCYFLSRARSFDETRTIIDQRYGLLAPIERYADFVAALADRFGREPPDSPTLNVGPQQGAIEEARAVLGARIAHDHREDLRLYQYVGETFDARRGSLTFALRA
jgi:hypothetical protein